MRPFQRDARCVFILMVVVLLTSYSPRQFVAQSLICARFSVQNLAQDWPLA